MSGYALTHSSFFSGGGGLDRGLERAGWRTLSTSEIEPYPSALLAEYFPDAPNLGDITKIPLDGDDPWRRATLFSGGFPCQDLSVAGRRAGMGTAEARTRSGLAFAFLDIVDRCRPAAVLLENVPGLLSSHRGRDMAALVGLLGELRYGWAYRILDAQFFGVPQRRRRVFIVAIDSERCGGTDRAAEVLSVGSRCGRHPPAGSQAWSGAPRGPRGRADILRQAISAKWSKGYSGPAGDEHHNLVVGEAPDAAGVREADGLAGGLLDRASMAGPLLAGGSGGQRTTDMNVPLVLAGTLRVGPAKIADGGPGDTVPITLAAGPTGDDPRLPLGLDSHRYRVLGNGVVVPVAQWIGERLAAALAGGNS